MFEVFFVAINPFLLESHKWMALSVDPVEIAHSAAFHNVYTLLNPKHSTGGIIL